MAREDGCRAGDGRQAELLEGGVHFVFLPFAVWLAECTDGCSRLTRSGEVLLTRKAVLSAAECRRVLRAALSAAEC